MIYSNNFFTSHYLYSPKTYYHNLKLYIKIYYIFNILLVIPYINFNKTTTFIVITFLIIEMKILKKLPYFVNLHGIHILTIILNCIILMSQLKKNNSLNFPEKNFFRPIFIYFLGIHNNNCKKNNIIVLFHLVVLSIPKWILKLIFIYTFSKTSINTLYLYTQHEAILEALTEYLKNITKKIKVKLIKYTMNLLLGYIFLEDLKSYLSKINLSINIKNLNLTNKKKPNVYIILNKFANIFLYNQNEKSLILWNRNIDYKSFNNFKIYE